MSRFPQTLVLVLAALGVLVSWRISPPALLAQAKAQRQNLAVLPGSTGQGADATGKPAGKKHKPRFTIGKETTFVTGPLDKDGYIDYATALNERLREGVTPENNANVLLWKALGPRPEGATMPAEFYRWLEIQPLPEQGAYFRDLLPFLKEEFKVDPGQQTDQIFDELERTTRRPWTPRQYPRIAAWLTANEKPLALVVAATRRTHYFSPLVTAGAKQKLAGLIGVQLSGVQKCRALAYALNSRALLRLGQGRDEDAWQDLLAGHRLGRLVARGGTLIEHLVGNAIDSNAGTADLAFLERTKLTAPQIQDCLRDLQKLPPLPPVADRVNLGERFVLLDIIGQVDRGGLKALEALAGGVALGGAFPLSEQALENVDWSPALRNANRWYDRLAGAMRAPNRPARAKQLDKIVQELKNLRADLQESNDTLLILLDDKTTPQARGKVLGDVLITLLLPAVEKVQQAADRNEQLQRNLHVAFALAAYRLAHGRYPLALAALAPKYLAQIPHDSFSGQALIYRPSEKGYLLYSVGVNGRDEQGRGYDDQPPGDDLSVRMPLPELRQQ